MEVQDTPYHDTISSFLQKLYNDYILNMREYYILDKMPKFISRTYGPRKSCIILWFIEKKKE